MDFSVLLVLISDFDLRSQTRASLRLIGDTPKKKLNVWRVNEFDDNFRFTGSLFLSQCVFFLAVNL